MTSTTTPGTVDDEIDGGVPPFAVLRTAPSTCQGHPPEIVAVASPTTSVPVRIRDWSASMRAIDNPLTSETSDAIARSSDVPFSNAADASSAAGLLLSEIGRPLEATGRAEVSVFTIGDGVAAAGLDWDDLVRADTRFEEMLASMPRPRSPLEDLVQEVAALRRDVEELRSEMRAVLDASGGAQ